jgi:hypothetical protein
MSEWGCYIAYYDYDCVYGVCFAVRTNEFLSCDGYYKSFFSDSLHRA